MDHPEKPSKAGKPRILLAPLDWGLGHATRLIPLVQELLTQGAEPWLAATGNQATVLAESFPALPILKIPGYNVKYARTRSGLALKMLLQVPDILGTIREENRWLKKMVSQHGFDAVISDNRYGLHHPGIPSVFITHQLQIQTALGKRADNWLRKINYRYINRFNACWVPDYAGEPNLAGILSHPPQLPSVPVYYTGPLTRVQKKNNPEQKGHLLLLLSGPEPQRSILEEKILAELAHYNGTATLVRGLPGALSMLPSGNQIRIYNHLPATELTDEIEKAEWIICRSGYSSIMDLAGLQKKTIFVPTPGQTEQEFLASYHYEMKSAFTISQSAFTLEKALAGAANFHYHPFPSGGNQLAPLVKTLLQSLQ